MTPRFDRKRAALIVAGAAVATAGTVGGAAALSGSDDDATDRPIPPSVVEQAERAALAETGQGTVTGTEVDDEESTYEVEVTLDDGREVDVQLDEDLEVVGSESETDDDEPGAGDD